jgi:hypothetical protein
MIQFNQVILLIGVAISFGLIVYYIYTNIFGEND